MSFMMGVVEELVVGRKLVDVLLEGDAQLTWYVVRSATRRELHAEERLIAAGFVVHMPRLARWRRHARTKSRVETPLLPGYLFVGIEPGRSLHDLEEVDGVHCIVRFCRDRDPQPVPFRDVTRFRDLELAGEFDKTLKRKPADLPKPGEPVRIVAGQFQGFPATFVQMKPDQRVEVLFQMFGRWTPLQLKEAEVDRFAPTED